MLIQYGQLQMSYNQFDLTRQVIQYVYMKSYSELDRFRPFLRRDLCITILVLHFINLRIFSFYIWFHSFEKLETATELNNKFKNRKNNILYSSHTCFNNSIHKTINLTQKNELKILLLLLKLNSVYRTQTSTEHCCRFLFTQHAASH